jgi:hypothetical protein
VSIILTMFSYLPVVVLFIAGMVDVGESVLLELDI